VLVHFPFWLMLAGYLVLRFVAFGKILRQDAPPSLPRSLIDLYVSIRALWLSPTMLVDSPPWFGFALLGATVFLLGAPILLIRGGPGSIAPHRSTFPAKSTEETRKKKGEREKRRKKERTQEGDKQR